MDAAHRTLAKLGTLAAIGVGLAVLWAVLVAVLQPSSALADDASDSTHGVLAGLTATVTPATEAAKAATDTVTPVADRVAKPVADRVAKPVADKVTKPVAEKVITPVAEAVAPVVSPVADAVAPAVTPVTEAVSPVLAPVTDAVAPVLAPVTDAVAPVVTPVTDAVAPVLTPVTDAVAPLPEPVTTDAEPVVDAEVPPAPVDPPLGGVVPLPDPADGVTDPGTVAPGTAVDLDVTTDAPADAAASVASRAASSSSGEDLHSWRAAFLAATAEGFSSTDASMSEVLRDSAGPTSTPPLSAAPSGSATLSSAPAGGAAGLVAVLPFGFLAAHRAWVRRGDLSDEPGLPAPFFDTDVSPD